MQTAQIKIWHPRWRCRYSTLKGICNQENDVNHADNRGQVHTWVQECFLATWRPVMTMMKASRWHPSSSVWSWVQLCLRWSYSLELCDQTAGSRIRGFSAAVFWLDLKGLLVLSELSPSKSRSSYSFLDRSYPLWLKKFICTSSFFISA